MLIQDPEVILEGGLRQMAREAGCGIRTIYLHWTAGRYGLTASMLLCNGPYYLSAMDPTGQSLTLVRNENYEGLTPGSIKRAVTFQKVFIGGTPRLMEASSTLGSICIRKALELRTV